MLSSFGSLAGSTARPPLGGAILPDIDIPPQCHAGDIEGFANSLNGRGFVVSGVLPAYGGRRGPHCATTAGRGRGQSQAVSQLTPGQSVEIVLLSGLPFLPAVQHAMLARPEVERMENL